MTDASEAGPGRFMFSLTMPTPREVDLRLPAPELLSPADGRRLLQSMEDTDGVVQSPVQFIAARNGEGTSSLARDFALVCARELHLRVLLLDLESPGNRQLTWLRAHLPSSGDIQPSGGQGWSKDMTQIATAFGMQEIAGTRLHVNQRVLPPLPNSAYWRAIFQVLQEQFDVVVVDSAPLQRSFDGVRLSSQVATNILVVEAEATKSSISRNLRNRIEDLGGEIAGCLVNKRRFYIPRWLYQWL